MVCFKQKYAALCIAKQYINEETPVTFGLWYLTEIGYSEILSNVMNIRCDLELANEMDCIL